LAEAIAKTKTVTATPTLAKLLEKTDVDAADAARAYLAIGDALALDRLRQAAEQALIGMPYWDRLATRGLIRELEQLQSDATQIALNAEAHSDWVKQHRPAISTVLKEVKTYTRTKPGFAQFALATDAVRKFMHSLNER
jgi:glutamate dehydrogenase